MTRSRMYGSDHEFGAWLRGLGVAGGPLPSISQDRGTTITDWDGCIHQYKTPRDGKGTRDIHCMITIEAKSRFSDIPSSQLETLWFQHQSIVKSGKKNDRQEFPDDVLRIRNRSNPSQEIWHFGVAVIRYNTPAVKDATVFQWGRFDYRGNMKYREIGIDIVIRLLQFDYNPCHLIPMAFRRHHKTKIVETEEGLPICPELTTVVRTIHRS